METISRPLLTFLLNGIWQIPLAAIVAALVCRLMRTGPATHRHAVWVAALAAAILLPLSSMRAPQSTASLTYEPSLAGNAALPRTIAPASSHAVLTPASGRPSRTISLTTATANVLLWAYLGFLLYRLAMLVRAALRTTLIVRSAHAAPIPPPLQRACDRCRRAFALDRIQLLFSTQVSGPVTAGRRIILPESMLAETDADLLATAIGHEMAHIARHDFACKVFYELLLLPLSFHPATRWIQRGMERTREMACDEFVTARLIDPTTYARSIMTFAMSMTAHPRPGYTLGVFDGDILEERIRRLIAPRTANPKRARALLVTGLAAIAACAIAASSLALTARAQSAAALLMQQGEAALQRGDGRQAIELYQNAVKLEPANLKAKLRLADCMMNQYVAGQDPNSSYVTAARQQLSDILAIEPRNRDALKGMMHVATLSRQFAEAHDWAVKAIAADSTDPIPYYTAGFIDWSLTYPDYSTARKNAGMQPQDPGIIPDTAIRRALRDLHGAQLADGFRMLQTALQLNPDYADAMAYMNLLYRIQAAVADTDEQSAELIAKADDFVRQALAAKKRLASNPSATQPATMQFAAPPPPPPPPPPSQGATSTPNRIRIAADVLGAKLINQPAPVYPQAARQAGITGSVELDIVVAKNGKVSDIRVLPPAQPELAKAAMDAVWQWVYQPTLLNGQPVEVATHISVTFKPDGQ